MKNNIYIFSNSILSRKNDSFTLETMKGVDAINEIDIYETEQDGVLLPAPKTDGNGNVKHIPAESVEAIYTFGEARFNTQFFKCAKNYCIPVNIFNYYRSYVGSFIPASKDGSGKIQILQYDAYLNSFKRLTVARNIIDAAIRNILSNLKTYLYSGVELEDCINNISSILEQVRFVDSIEQLLGFEGMTRNFYYQSWEQILKQETFFNKRIKKPPIGMVNSLISFGNSILYAVCLTEIFRTKLNPFIGFIHETGDNKHPLVYDISEIFKPIIVDKVIFRCINLNIISHDDFKPTDKGFYLKDNARKKFVEEFENRLKTVIQHKRINRRISYRSLIRMECYNLINFLNGNIKTYEPFKAS